MRKTFTYYLLLLGAIVFLPSFVNPNAATEIQAKSPVKFSKKVKAIIDNKCYGCHSENGRSDKAKAGIMWDDLAGLSPDGMKEKLDMIEHVLEDSEMPPARFLENNPDKKLTDKEVATMEKWVSKAMKKVSKL